MSIGPLMIDLAGRVISPQEKQWLLHPAVGGVILFRRNFQDKQQIAALIDELHALKSPALLVAVDQEGGRVQRFTDGFTAIPAMRTLGDLYDREPLRALRVSELLAWHLAAELRAVNVDFSFTPVLDLATVHSQIIGDRAFHSQPDIVALIAASFSQGLHRGGMQAIGKHFPGHGTVVADSHLECPLDQRPLSAIEQDLKPFELMIDQGLQGIMSAHVVYARVDDKPASFSPYWLNDILRGQLSYQGVIFSDDLSMRGAHAVGDIRQRISLALQAGSDMVLVCNQPAHVPLALELLDDYVNPQSADRLAQFYGQTSELMTAEQQQCLHQFLAEY
ncbi:MAG: beta-N-acetylhexosaminidase [Gammaproteobacteria bacterium TMED119]|nr:MAG: beta-N-acetylhexosaminidase [Gammaproteobacteria bacterium TMED119]RCL46136.1 MAG: beta-N-acetylhexosaminidase [Candidatus Thioglobus sp.]